VSGQFRLDPDRTGETKLWHKSTSGPIGRPWRFRTLADQEIRPIILAPAWYHRLSRWPREWKDRNLRVEFEAVYHSATVWVNGQEAAQHLRKGYTAFTLDITLTRIRRFEFMVVRVDNSFDQPCWPPADLSIGRRTEEIYRPVSLLVSPKVFIERVDVDAVPDIAAGTAVVSVSVFLQNSGNRPWLGPSGFGLPTSKPACPSWKEKPRTLCTWRRARKRAGLCRLRHYATQNYGTSTIPIFTLRVVLTERDQDFHALESTSAYAVSRSRTRASI